MQYKYFTPDTKENMKKQYRDLCMKHHPDKGGDTRTMQEINAEWSDIQAREAYTEARTRQEEAHASGRKSAADFHDLDEVTEALRQKIEIALNLSGVEVELMGLWVWVTGETKQHKETLKANGFKWSQNKTAWYFAGVPSFNRKPQDLDSIRNNYGSQKFNKRDNAKHHDRPVALEQEVNPR